MDAMMHGMSRRHSTFPPEVGIDPTGLLVAKTFEEMDISIQPGKEVSMALIDSTRGCRCWMAAIAAVAVFTALAVTGSLSAGAAGQPTASTVEAPAAAPAAAAARGHLMASPKGSSDVGIRGHGFVAENGVFTTIDAPGAGAFTVVFGIDENGRTVGGYVDNRGRLHGFLRDQEAFTVIDFPGAAATFVSRINAKGQIVGAYSEDKNTPALKSPHGFLLDKGVFTKIDVPGASETRPFGINNAGQIVGEYVDEARRSHGFLLNNGVYTTIDAPSGTSTWATDIDDHGRIVGISFGGAAGTIAASVRGFLRDAQGAFTPIDAPAAPPPPGQPELPTTQPFGINDRGQIVGGYADAAGVFHGFLRDSSGNFTTIDAPGAVLTVPFAINNHGQIVGLFSDGVRNRGFLLSNGRFTRITPPGALAPTTGIFVTDIDDRGRIAGASL
jgi:uncharacterized membrane protein